MNMGSGEATIRFAAGIATMVLGIDLYAMLAMDGILWPVAVCAVLTGFLIATALYRECPVYGVLGVQRAHVG